MDGVVERVRQLGPNVDADGVPGLVARGVMPFRFLPYRADFQERFLGCSEAQHVNDVLLVEGFYSGSGSDHAKRKKAARERVKKRRQRAC